MRMEDGCNRSTLRVAIFNRALTLSGLSGHVPIERRIGDSGHSERLQEQHSVALLH